MELDSFITEYRRRRDGTLSFRQSWARRRHSKPPAKPYCGLREPLEDCSVASIQAVWLALAEQDERHPAVCFRMRRHDDGVVAHDDLVRTFFRPLVERRVFGPVGAILYPDWGLWIAPIFHPLDGPEDPQFISAAEVHALFRSRGYDLMEPVKKTAH